MLLTFMVFESVLNDRLEISGEHFGSAECSKISSLILYAEQEEGCIAQHKPLCLISTLTRLQAALKDVAGASRSNLDFGCEQEHGYSLTIGLGRPHAPERAGVTTDELIICIIISCPR
jgi:hypothetical protein